MKLRQWQHNSITLAFNRYLNNHNHFLALATPGAGKTLMASAQNILDTIRQKNADAARLTVAFSVEHAQKISAVTIFEGCHRLYQVIRA